MAEKDQNSSLRGTNRRIARRKKRRIRCQLWAGEREHSAMILDLSESGLFVQTHAKTQRGDRLRLQFPHEDALIELEVEVVRSLHVPQNLITAAKGGIGVRIVSAPEEYYEMITGLGISERAKPVFEFERARGLRFRVHVSQVGGSRSRRVEVAASDEATAGARALEELGSGWRVLRVETL